LFRETGQIAQVTSSNVFAFGGHGQTAPASLTGSGTIVQYALDGTAQHT